MEVSQFTDFQQFGGVDCHPVCGELTYGTERLAMFIQGVDNVYDIQWTKDITYGDVHHQHEVDYSKDNFFEVADTAMLFQLFDLYEKECQRVLAADLPQPAFDYCLKCSHTFNLLDARSAISVTERQSYVLRVRNSARACCAGYLAERSERSGIPPAERGAYKEGGGRP